MTSVSLCEQYCSYPWLFFIRNAISKGMFVNFREKISVLLDFWYLKY
jgi:hypothetical protein